MVFKKRKMRIDKQTFFHVNDQQNWQKEQNYFLGKEKSSRYKGLFSRSFFMPKAAGSQEGVSLDTIAAGMGQYIKTQQKPDFLPENYHYDPSKTILELLPMIGTHLSVIRELIFEDVRRTFFPEKFSRLTGVHIIPATKEALAFWLPKLKTPHAKIYKLELTGKIHSSPLALLSTNSLAADFLTNRAYQYWLNEVSLDSPDDEYIFEGIARVLDIIDANSLASK